MLLELKHTAVKGSYTLLGTVMCSTDLLVVDVGLFVPMVRTHSLCAATQTDAGVDHVKKVFIFPLQTLHYYDNSQILLCLTFLYSFITV